MADLLIYWRDYLANRQQTAEGGLRRWHSSSRSVAALQPGDRMWLVTSGAGAGQIPTTAAFLVEVWTVQEVHDNPDDAPAYPADRYRHRVVATVCDDIPLDEPINVDSGLRPIRYAASVPIGRLLQGPRRLKAEQIAMLMRFVTDNPSLSDAPGGASSRPSTIIHPDKNLIALGIRQPWVELILRGRKTIEVRTLPTNHRGPIYVYASKALSDISTGWEILNRSAGESDDLPKGRLVGTVEIVNCRRCVPDDAASACVPPSLLTDAYAWELAHPLRLESPLAVRFQPYGVWFYPFRRR